MHHPTALAAAKRALSDATLIAGDAFAMFSKASYPETIQYTFKIYSTALAHLKEAQAAYDALKAAA